LGAAITEVGTLVLRLFASAETGHAAGALIVLSRPALFRALVIAAAATFRLFRDGGAGVGGAARAVALLQGFVVEAVVPSAEPSA
jgi:hypothetical protein